MRAVTALSPRQSQVAERVAKGMTSKEISGQLDISLGTVETHVRRI
jgi:DNA-binding CsgD family transcriptional regulator